MKKFKCTEKEAVTEYQHFTKIYHFDKYKLLYSIMMLIWNNLGFDERDYEDNSYFKYKNLMCYVDKENGSYCEIIGSGWFLISDRIIIHKKILNKIIQYNYKKNFKVLK